MTWARNSIVWRYFFPFFCFQIVFFCIIWSWIKYAKHVLTRHVWAWMVFIHSRFEIDWFNDKINWILNTPFFKALNLSIWIIIVAVYRRAFLCFIFMMYLSHCMIISIDFRSILFLLQVLLSPIGNFELQILEISNTNSHLLSGYCCGVSSELRSTRTTECPPCATAFRLCLKEYQQTTSVSTPGVLSGCSFGNVSSAVTGGSSFVLTDPEAGSLVLPFSFRWTVSTLT